MVHKLRDRAHSHFERAASGNRTSGERASSLLEDCRIEPDGFFDF
jgi:hypothetical protein